MQQRGIAASDQASDRLLQHSCTSHSLSHPAVFVSLTASLPLEGRRERERERSSSWSAHSPVVKEAHVRRLSNQREAEEQCCWRERSRGRLRSCQSVILSCSSFLPLRRSAYVMDDTHTQDSRRVTSPGETGGERNRDRERRTGLLLLVSMAFE